MGYVKKGFFVEQETKTFLFLMRHLGLSQSKAQRMIDKGHIFINGKPIRDKASKVKGNIEISLFEPIDMDIPILFENEDFAILEKPHDMLTHPRKKDDAPSLLDAARFKFGDDANCVHRLDAQTSGLVIISKHKKAERELKSLFEQKLVTKRYLALIEGVLEKEVLISAPILQNSDYADIKMKVLIDERGRDAKTLVRPLKQFVNRTLVEAFPQTGRQHQIRVHLWHIGHLIVGEHIYGRSKEETESYLDERLDEQQKRALFGSSRLMLHADHLSFKYGKEFEFFSRLDFEALIRHDSLAPLL